MTPTSMWRCLLALCGLVAATAFAALPEHSVLTLESTALQPQFRTYTTEDGLPSMQVRGLLQDRQGLLWIATFGGLASFDGQRFETWQAPDDPRPLTVETLLEGADGELWIAAEKRGLYRLDPQRRQWQHYSTSAEGGRRIVTDDVWAMLANPDGSFWLAGYGGGLQRIRASGEAETASERWSTLYDSESITALGRSGAAGVWLGTLNGLWFWPDGANRAQHCLIAGDGAVLNIRGSKDAVWVVSIDGKLWRFAAGCDDAQLVFASETSEQQPQQVLLEGSALRAIGLRVGLGLNLSPAGSAPQPWRWIRPRFGIRGALPSATSTSLLKDREGGLWIGMFGGGLAWLPPLAEQWAVLPHDPVSAGGLGGRVVRDALRAPDGALWIASSDGGLERLDPLASAVQRWTPPPQLNEPRSASWSLALAGERLWAGTRDYLWHGRLVGDSLQFEQRIDGLRGVHAMLSQGSQLWAAARADALYRLDPDGRILDRFAPGVLAGDEVNQLLLDLSGRLWVASDGGLQRFDASTGRFGFALPINHGDVASVCFQRDSLWRYVDARLEHWDTEGQRLRASYAQAAGIPTLDTLQLRCAGDTIWLLSRLGIHRFVPASGHTAAPLQRGDGLPGIELGQRQFAVNAGPYWWIGGDGGLLGLPAVLPELSPVGFPLLLHSSRVQRGDRWLELAGSQLQLQPDDRNLRIESRAIQFWQAAATVYRFELRGGDSSHSFEQTSAALELPRLAPGDYQLRVHASNPRLGQELQALEMGIVVSPPWWAQSWARLVFLLSGLLLLSVTIQRSRQQLRRKHARQLEEQRLHFAERIAEEKSRFLAQTSHEMKNLLGGASGVADLIVGQSTEPPVRHKAFRLVELCAELMRLLDDLLENARLERGQVQIQRQRFNLRRCLDETLDSHLQRARSKGLGVSVELPDVTAECFGDPLRLKQILGNLLSNAVKYTDRGAIAVQVEQSADKLRLHVTDTGPGLAAGARERLFEPFALGRHRRDSTGLGLSICQQLAQLAGGQIEVHSDPAGTRFSVELPWPPQQPEAAMAPASGPLLVLVGNAALLQSWQQAADALQIRVRRFESLFGLCADQPELIDQECLGILLPGAPPDTLELALALLAQWPGPPTILAPAAEADARLLLASLIQAKSAAQAR